MKLFAPTGTESIFARESMSAFLLYVTKGAYALRKSNLVFGPTPMRRLYLAVPLEYEDQVLSEIGELGVVHLINELQTRRSERTGITTKIGSRFERLNEKLDIILGKEAPERLAKLSVQPLSVGPTCEETERFLSESEAELNDLTGALEKFQREIGDIHVVQEKLNFLVANGLRIDEVGIFRHIFVKVGFMKSALTTRFATYVNGTSIISVIRPGRPRESLMVIAGLNDDRPFAEETLRLMNFEEITLPSDLNGDSKLAYDQLEERIKLKEDQSNEVKNGMLEIKKRAAALTLCINETARYEAAKDLLIRTKRQSLVHGWIPKDTVGVVKERVEKVVPKEKIYFKVEEPKLEDTVPVQYSSKGIVRAFELFTFLQGVPNYFEINPTPIYTLLYVIMFGMMFGDIGAGFVLVALGALLTRMRKGLFAFSLRATKQIAYIMVSCGVVTVVFGFLYGVFFLTRTSLPHLLNPLTDLEEIIVIALAFGVAQIMLSLVLNIINMVRRREPLRVIFGERGAVGLVFYSAGVVVGYSFIVHRNFEIFIQGTTALFSAIVLVSLALILLSPLIEARAKKEEASVSASKKLVEGFGLGLEAFIAFISNTVSYIRLAAFAIAHEAIGIAAEVLGTVFGAALSLVLLNVLNFGVEGFASFIQSLRLMYYEFSTRFLLKDGIAYEPFRIGRVRIKI